MSQYPPRYRSLVRCLRLASLLSGRQRLPEWSVMADELGVTTRTVRRYIAALEAAHFHVPEAVHRPWDDSQVVAAVREDVGL